MFNRILVLIAITVLVGLWWLGDAEPAMPTCTPRVEHTRCANP